MIFLHSQEINCNLHDLITGKVNSVAYQPGKIDAFYHRYSYDAENRLTQVETSKDKIVWERDARYNYYKHGALARTLLGELQMQGIDYAYTLQGQLKGINSTSVGNGVFDMGQDGKIGSSNSNIARDAYGISLNYFTGDYKPINNSVTPFASISVGNDLFNGNIKAMVVNIPKLGDPLTYGFKYDQLNRLVAMDAYNGLNNATNTFTAITINDYKERLTYDPNGNIKTYLRNGTGVTINLNNYSYTYTTGTNKLASITNSINAQTKTYGYDEIGNTTNDGMQGMTNAVWNVYGKLQSATNKDGAGVIYTYGASGQRINKKVGALEEWYVKDAGGNTMATYSKDPAVNSNHLSTTEFYKYGSSLLSIKNHVVDMEVLAVNNGVSTFTRGEDNYILTDANGNTRAIATDKRIQVADPVNTAQVLYYLADVKTANYYSSFGANAKTFGQTPVVAFNGQRKSIEIGSDAQTALYWEYNGDVGRRANLDPKPNDAISPYAVFGNNPIWHIDILGDSIVDPNRTVGYKVFVVNKTRDLGAKLSYARFKKAQEKDPTHTILIETDKLDKTTAADIINKLGKNGFIKTLALDYHRSAYDDMPASGKDAFFSGLANGYTGDKTEAFLGMCWAGGGPDLKGIPTPDLTKGISKQLDKATVYGLQTEAWNPSFYFGGNFGVLNPVYSLGQDKVAKREKEHESTWTISTYSPTLKTYTSISVLETITFTTQGTINRAPYVPNVQKKQDWKKNPPNYRHK